MREGYQQHGQTYTGVSTRPRGGAEAYGSIYMLRIYIYIGVFFIYSFVYRRPGGVGRQAGRETGRKAI